VITTVPEAKTGEEPCYGSAGRKNEKCLAWAL
jgi:hypothetical protein